MSHTISEDQQIILQYGLIWLNKLLLTGWVTFVTSTHAYSQPLSKAALALILY